MRERSQGTTDSPADDPHPDTTALTARVESLSPQRRALLERLRGASGVLAPTAIVPSGPLGSGEVDATASCRPGGSGEDGEPFPLTPVQEAYWVGRDPTAPMGGIAAYGYGEFDVDGLDVSRLERAWNRLVKRHPALRTVVLPDGSQRCLPSVPWYEVAVDDLRDVPTDEAERWLRDAREAVLRGLPRPDAWPLFDVRATRLDNHRTRVHVGFDMLVADARSFDILASELDALLEDPDQYLEPIGLTFRDYVLRVRQGAGDGLEAARRYWFSRLDELPGPPALPRASVTDGRSLRFIRHGSTLPDGQWRAFCEHAARRRLTPSSALLSAYAEVVALWSTDRHFTMNLTVFNRRPVHPDVERVVGCFTELTLLAVDMTPRSSFEERARRVQDRLWEDLEHDDVGATEVLRELTRRTGVPVLMPVVFTSALGTTGGQRSRFGTPARAVSQTPQVSIDHQVVESANGVDLWWDAADELFPPGVVDAMFAAYLELIGRLCTGGAWDARSPVPLPQPMRTVRVSVERSAPRQDPVLLHEMVDLRRAELTAVTGGNGTCTRGELDARGNRIAAALQQAGAVRNRPVGVLTRRGPDQVAAVLGVLRSGAAYLPLSPDLPPERLAALIAQAGLQLVVTDSATVHLVPAGVRPVPVDASATSSGPVDPRNLSGDLAYVIFTSGSTGTPKGVMISHAAATNTLHDVRRLLSLTEGDAVLAVSDLSFDLSVFDVFGMLAAGGRVVTPADGGVRDPGHWAELVRDHGVSVWNSVPALMGLLLDHVSGTGQALPSLRSVLLSGDWIPVGLPARIRSAAPHARVIGAGGATEAAIWSVAYPIDDTDLRWPSVPYGFPLANQTVAVRTGPDGEAPDWVSGELLIGGAGVALGYWREPALTAERFVPDPERPGGRRYRTGDIARHTPDGNLEFLGRVDAQVKVNGYRVDLSEVEGVLADHPEVGEACAVVTGPRDGNRRIVAFVTPGTVDVGVLRASAARTLAPAAVPSVIEAVDALPLTPNGKVDRIALAARAERRALTASSFSAAGQERATRGRPVAEVVAAVVAEVMELPMPPAQDEDLLTLGADSLTVIRVGNRLQASLGFRPAFDRVFADPTVAGIAVECERSLLERVAAGGASARPELSPGSLLALPGPRPVPASASVIPLLPVDNNGTWESVRTRRSPLDRPVPLAALSDLLAVLQVVRTAAGERRRYPSAGALYPVRVYIAGLNERLEGVPAGFHLYDPAAHGLVRVGDGSTMAPEAFDPFVNAPVVRDAAFVLLVTGYLPAVEPRYGGDASRFVTLEAGAVTQVLREAAPRSGLGLCLIGDADPAGIRAAAGLQDGEQVVVLLTGGVLDPQEPIVPAAAGPVAGQESGEL